MTGALAATAIAVTASVGAAPAASANSEAALNGTFRVLSDGQWARTNDVKIKQETVIETWTISTTCTSPLDCSGEVTSDRGWTGTARLDDFWYVDHVIPNWIPCPDGTFAAGYQKFILWGINPVTEEKVYNNIQTLAGRNVTKGPSGACGANKPVVIELPVSIAKIS